MVAADSTRNVEPIAEPNRAEQSTAQHNICPPGGVSTSQTVGKTLRMTFDGALVAAGWGLALVFSVGGSAVGLLWSTTAMERWLDEHHDSLSPRE